MEGSRTTFEQDIWLSSREFLDPIDVLQVAREGTTLSATVNVHVAETEPGRPVPACIRPVNLRLHIEGLPPGDYTWRIRSVDAAGKTGPYGDGVPFTVRPLAEVTEIDGSAAAAGNTREVTFRWQAGQPGQRYRFQMSRTPDFRKTDVDMLVDQAEVTLPRLRSGTWYLRAQTIDVDGFEGPFPAPQQVDVPCRWCRIGAFFVGEFHHPVSRAKAQTCQRIHDHPQTVNA